MSRLHLWSRAVILVLTQEEDNGYAASIKAVFPDMPIVFTQDKQQILNWLPLVDAVFVHHKSTQWIGNNPLPAHHQVILVLPETPNTTVDTRNMFKNMRAAKIKDVYLLSEPEDVELLKARFSDLTIQEK